MSVDVLLPALGESVVEGTVSRWLVKEGERVEEDQPLVEVTTDKVDAEIPAPAAGVVEKILAREGEVVAVGARLATIAAGAAASAAAKPEREPKVPARPAAAAAPERPGAAPVRATPLARRVAEREGIDLASVAASGPAGRVTRADVAREQAARRAPPAEPERAAPRSAGRAGGRPAYLEYQLQPGDRVIPMSP